MKSILILTFLLATVLSQCSNKCILCQSPPVCSLCVPSHALTLTGGCTPNLIPNCRVYASPSTCQICQSTFRAVNGVCQKDTSGCLVRSAQDSCLYCGFGTFLSGNFCSGVVNCQQRTNNGVCTVCRKGYTLQLDRCVDNRPECIFQAAGVCSQCKSGHVLNGFSCLPVGLIPPNCELYDQLKGFCLVCSQGYEMHHKFCQRVDRITPYGVINDPSSPVKALQMPNDVLGASSGTTLASRKVGQDNILPSGLQASISTFGSTIKLTSDSCWLRANNGSCQVCKQGYNLFEGACTKLPAACVKFTTDMRQCLECDPILTLQNGSCVDVNCAVGIFSRCSVCKNQNYVANAQGVCMNRGCVKMVAGKCQQCGSGAALDSQGLCSGFQVISQNSNNVTPNTNTQNTQNAQTTQTTQNTRNTQNTQNIQNTQNTQNIQTQQAPNPVTPPTSSIRNCEIQQAGTCARCITNFFPDGNGGCKRIIIGCLKMDVLQEKCIQCLGIYILDGNGGCLFPEAQTASTNTNNNRSTITTQSSTTPQTPPTPAPPAVKTNPFPLDPNCQTPNNNSCAICQPGFLLNTFNFSCWQIPKQCATFNQSSGQCLTCKFGFHLFTGWCLSRANKTDPNCQISDINNFCIKCQNAYYSYRGTCINNQDMCMTSQYRGGQCLSCYSGYILFNGVCYLLSEQPACKTYNFQNTCVQCWNRFFLLAGVCLPVNPLCIGYDPNTGVCKDCVAGYGLSSITKECVKVQPAPINCAKADPSGKCLTCSARHFLTSNNTCSPAPLLCQNFNAVGGQCQSCFPGYKLMSDSSCLKQNLALGCTAATSTGVCSACLPQYVLAIQGNCVSRDPSCQSYDGALCTKCRPLYYISKGRCIKQTPKEKDPNCIINSLYNYCQQCTPGYFVFEGNCKLVDQLCRTYKQSNGDCLSCYDGYRLNKGRCYLDTPVTNCQTFIGLNCEVCQPGFALQANGSCA